MKNLSTLAVKAIASIALVAGAAMPAAAGEIKVSGQGSCMVASCNNTNVNALSNTLADSTHHDWFAFDLSALQGHTFLSASIHIFNHADNAAANQAVFSLYQAIGINYNNLVTGNVVGTVKGAAADKNSNHYVHIQLNAEGLNALNGKAGKSILFGGAASAGQFFGQTSGLEKAYLKFDSVKVVPEQAVPEPASIALFGLGLLAFVGARRRKQK